ncbi:MAG: hypothetical protein ACAH95_10350 [Fimbriimonas sp.]
MRVIQTAVGAVREGRNSRVLPPMNEIFTVAALFAAVLTVFIR